MTHIYFVCMGNYYRSRLGEELARHYGQKYGVDVTADSGGLQPDPRNVGPMASMTTHYLQQKSIPILGGDRYPKQCSEADVEAAEIVICTDRSEQLRLFNELFPNFSGDLRAWQAPDWHSDPFLATPELIDRNVLELIKTLASSAKQ